MMSLNLPRRAFLSGAACLMLLAPFSVRAAEPTPIGKTVALRGDVLVSSPPSAARRAKKGNPVHLNDVVATGPDSAARFALNDGSTFSLGSSARAQIDDFVYDADASASRVTIDFTRGAFRFLSGKATKAMPGKSLLMTPLATIGIRGTIVSGMIGPDALKLYADLTGEIVVTKEDAEGSTLIVLDDPEEPDGGVDVMVGDKTYELRKAGEALLIIAPGTAEGEPLGPRRLLLDDGQRRRLGERAAPPRLGPDRAGGNRAGGRNGIDRGGRGPSGSGGPAGPGGSGPGPMGGGAPGGGPPR